jgi:hypothetical protein
MPTITTKLLGNTNDADPKPVTGFDYAGQPMKPGGHYNGRPEHMGASNTQNNKASNKRGGLHGITKAEFLARIIAGKARAKERREKERQERETQT